MSLAIWCRQDIGLLCDLPPGPRFEGLSIDLNNPVCRGIKSCIFFLESTPKLALDIS